jgi:hypothetical protein
MRLSPMSISPYCVGILRVVSYVDSASGGLLGGRWQAPRGQSMRPRNILHSLHFCAHCKNPQA